jgi:lactate dehydrogenase-like 2-hydroxyacid dehydrogenase
VDDAARYGVWVANSPDYGVGEVSLHALSMMLALIRNIVRYDKDIHAGNWHYSSSGPVLRAQDMTDRHPRARADRQALRSLRAAHLQAGDRARSEPDRR